MFLSAFATKMAMEQEADKLLGQQTWVKVFWAGEVKMLGRLGPLESEANFSSARNGARSY